MRHAKDSGSLQQPSDVPTQMSRVTLKVYESLRTVSRLDEVIGEMLPVLLQLCVQEPQNVVLVASQGVVLLLLEGQQLQLERILPRAAVKAGKLCWLRAPARRNIGLRQSNHTICGARRKGRRTRGSWRRTDTHSVLQTFPPFT